MNFLKLFLGIIFFSAVATLSSTQFIGCTKTKTITDTVTVVDYDLQDGLVAYYNFNNGSLNDGSGYGNNITFSNATPTVDRFGNANNAYLFDGVNSYMTVPDNPTLSPTIISIVAIVKFNGFNTGTCHFSQILMKGSQDQDQGVYGIRVMGGNGSCQAQLDTSTQKFNAFFGDYGYAASTLDRNYLVNTNKWVTYVYTYDGKKSCHYTNGQLTDSYDGSALYHPNGYDIYIGKTQNPNFPFMFNGVIDEIRIYNRPLSAGAVKQLGNLTN